MKDKNSVRIQTNTTLILCRRDHESNHITAQMGTPRFAWQDIPLQTEHPTHHITLHPNLPPAHLVNVGNPHAVIFLPANPQHFLPQPLKTLGPTLAAHPLFPEGANISFAHLSSPHEALVSHWERGAGPTPSCGTAACAVAACARQYQNIQSPLTVHFRGGPLQVHWEDTHLWLSGPVTLEETLTITLP